MAENNFRTIYYISDSTGVTVESLARSVLAQFPGIDLKEQRLSFVDSKDKAREAVRVINQWRLRQESGRPIVFYTFASDSNKAIVGSADALVLDCLEIFIDPVAKELGCQPAHIQGERFVSTDGRDYRRRIDAVNFSLNHDDGAAVYHLSQADVILMGVSRSGKTPTSLYLALHYGIFCANYPLVEEDLTTEKLPVPLTDYTDKLYGLSISAKRLSSIRSERRPGTRYADFDQCQREIVAARRIFEANGIPYLDVTRQSVEELAAKILQTAKIVFSVGQR